MAGTMAAASRARAQRQAMNAATYKPWPKSVEELALEQERKLLESILEPAAQTGEPRLDFYLNVGRRYG